MWFDSAGITVAKSETRQLGKRNILTGCAALSMKNGWMSDRNQTIQTFHAAYGHPQTHAPVLRRRHRHRTSTAAPGHTGSARLKPEERPSPNRPP